ncbi:hypothetical protein A1353_08690 [Methylomonas methanica]|uniref:Lipoprotein n=1 Tax=Methylomonas methanica TaxID=421 RepID=A0A177MME5_METMH|nr:hypothetical protein [Methylomonas methanica]OAI06503.1 hypothetical protein A1353_08690 [Methylomonas methanica]
MQKKIILSTLMTITGCSVTPTVQYTKLESSSLMPEGAFDSYFFQGSNIIIKPIVENLPQDQPTQSNKKEVDKKTDKITEKSKIRVIGFNAESKPKEYEEFKIALTRSDPFYSDGNINITKYENTALVKEIGTDTSDHRQAYIETAGSIIVKGLAMGLSGSEESKGANDINTDDIDPIDINELIKNILRSNKNLKPNDNLSAKLSNNVKINIHPTPPGAMATKELPQKTDSNLFIYAACRSVDLEFDYNKITYNFSLKISDPNFYETVEFPLKGKITSHSSCGVSVTTNNANNVVSNDKLITAIVDQAKAIKDAADAKSK